MIFSLKDSLSLSFFNFQDKRNDSIKSNNSKLLHKMDSLNDFKKLNNKIVSRVEESKYHSKSTIKLINII